MEAILSLAIVEQALAHQEEHEEEPEEHPQNVPQARPLEEAQVEPELSPFELVAPERPPTTPILVPNTFAMELILNARKPSSIPTDGRKLANVPYAIALSNARPCSLPNLIRGSLGDFICKGGDPEDAHDFDTGKFVFSLLDDFRLRDHKWYLFTPRDETNWLCLRTSTEMCDFLQRYASFFRSDQDCAGVVFLIQLYKPSMIPLRSAVPMESPKEMYGFATEFVDSRSLALIKTNVFEEVKAK